MAALGDICSAVERLPSAAVLTPVLEKCDNSRTFADIWQKTSQCGRISIRALRFHSAQNIKEAKEVRIQSIYQEVHSRAKLTDPVETGGNVDEAFP